MATKFCLNLSVENKLGISEKIVGVFSNYNSNYTISDDASTESNSYQRSILLHNYEDVLIRAKEDGKAVLVSANNKYFLKVYEKFKDTVQLILLATSSNESSVSYLKKFSNVIFVLIEMGSDKSFDFTQQEMLEDAIVINYAAKVCSTFLIYSLTGFPNTVLTIAIIEALSLNRKLRFSELKSDYIVARDADDILEDTQYCTELLRTYRNLDSPVYSCNNYDLFNILFDQTIGRYKEFAPFLDTYHEMRFNLYNKSVKDMHSVEGF